MTTSQQNPPCCSCVALPAKRTRKSQYNHRQASRPRRRKRLPGFTRLGREPHRQPPATRALPQRHSRVIHESSTKAANTLHQHLNYNLRLLLQLPGLQNLILGLRMIRDKIILLIQLRGFEAQLAGGLCQRSVRVIKEPNFLCSPLWWRLRISLAPLISPVALLTLLKIVSPFLAP